MGKHEMSPTIDFISSSSYHLDDISERGRLVGLFAPMQSVLASSPAAQSGWTVHRQNGKSPFVSSPRAYR